jgi:AcrR family transcriptional regulator
VRLIRVHVGTFRPDCAGEHMGERSVRSRAAGRLATVVDASNSDDLAARAGGSPNGTGRVKHRRLPAAERRRQIVWRAAELLDLHGYAQTSMEDIAAAVGIAKTSLYYYFKSKDELLYAIHGELINLLIERQDRRAGSGLSPEQQLLEVMGDLLELMETHRGHVRVFIEHHRELPDELRATMLTKRDYYALAVEELFMEGVEQGTIRQTDTRMATLALFGMCEWAYQWFRPGGPMRTREIAYSFWDILMHGVSRPAHDRAI